MKFSSEVYKRGGFWGQRNPTIQREERGMTLIKHMTFNLSAEAAGRCGLIAIYDLSQWTKNLRSQWTSGLLLKLAKMTM